VTLTGYVKVLKQSTSFNDALTRHSICLISLLPSLSPCFDVDCVLGLINLEFFSQSVV
jgi:hypothetical protein